MLNMDRKLQKHAEANGAIRTGVVGAGQMGRGLITQLVRMQGLTPSIVSARNVENAVNALVSAGIDRTDITIANTLSQANEAMERGKFVATNNLDALTKANLLDCVIDATGIPDVGAKVAYESLMNRKHVVMLNVETDVVLAPYLKRLAEREGVIYTGSAGDEPGAVMELYTFAKAIGLDVKVIGKGKNNKLAYDCTPESVLEEANRRIMSPKMLCAFKDGTKTMVELTAMSNATGMIPDVIGAHGIESDVVGLNKKFKLKKDGGILNRHGVVEFVNGIAPGVFATVATDNDEVRYQMDYLLMGSGPLWTLYRPYHLGSLETPLSAAKAVIDQEATIVPIDGLVSECITVAKRDLVAGETIDGHGGFTTYASIAPIEVSDQNRYVPYGLVTDTTKMKRSVKKGALLTLDDVELDQSTLIYKLRREQDALYGRQILD